MSKKHWTTELQEENARLKALVENKTDCQALIDLLKEIYSMAGNYYCDVNQIRYKIKEFIDLEA